MGIFVATARAYEQKEWIFAQFDQRICARSGWVPGFDPVVNDADA